MIDAKAPDLILLSFFDGVASAALLCQQICSERSWKWQAVLWESNPELRQLASKKFPSAILKEDVDEETPEKIIDFLEQIDPGSKALVIIAAGPPCPDYSRVRENAPGTAGPEGSKFVRFAELVKSFVENVVPQNKEDVRKLERALSAEAVMHDASDFGLIARPRLWWTRIPWQELSHRNDCPFTMRWSTYQGLPRVRFNVSPDKLEDYDLGDLSWPQCIMDKTPLPCLTTPAEDPKGRPAPRSCKGKTSSDAQQRWLRDGRQYAPWHYEADNMFRQTDNRLVLAPAEVKEQLHHLPRGWTEGLRGTARHRALANGWHIGAARFFLVLGILAATPQAAPARELSPLGGTAIDAMAKLWETKPLLNGPGVPVSEDALDLSAILDPEEHWSAACRVSHQNQSRPQLEPGLLQWLPLWQHWRRVVPEMRYAVAKEVEQLVSDLDDSVQKWYFGLKPHVQKAYCAKDRACSVQVPVIRHLASIFGWGDMDIFDELTEGFPLLGSLRPGLGWRLRDDARYSEPIPITEFWQENLKVVQRKLQQQRVDPAWEIMAAEIAADVKLGRMEGPFTAPPCWGKSMVALADYQHTNALLPGPCQHVPCCFAFAVHQVGSDGQPKVRRAEDWKRSLANSTVGAEDSPAYHDVSAFVKLAKAFRRAGVSDKLLLWGLDHESAYRQFPAAEPEHTYVILNTPSGPTLWRHNVLMFGSTASVWSYCRVADLMAWINRCMLLVPALHFVDDFGSCEPEDTAQSAFETSQQLCRALGLKFKESKAQPPEPEHVIQGVKISVHSEEAVLSCTQVRKDRMESSLVQLLLDNRLKPPEASALAGNLQFLASSLFGKSSAAAIRAFHQRARTGVAADYKQGWTLNQALRDAIAFLKYSFEQNVPRVIKFFVPGRSIVYADAFFQLGDERFNFRNMDDAPSWGHASPAAFANGWGFVATSGEQTWYAMGHVPLWFTRHFCSRRAYIYMLEIIAQVLPLYALSKLLYRDVILFVDNEPARHALVKGYSRDSNANKLLQTAWCCFEESRYQPQWQRVASSANISDAVSRQDDSFAKKSGWTLFSADWNSIFDELLRRCLQGPLKGL